MNRRIKQFVFVALLILLALPPAAAQTGGPPILVLGDSISAGAGASTPAQAFPAVLARLLGQPVATAGESGRNLGGVARHWAQLRGPRPVVVVEVGVNDALHYKAGWIGDAADWQAIYGALIADMRAAGVGRVVVVTPGPAVVPASDLATLAAYADAARHLDAIIVDTWPGLAAPGMLGADGVHPTDAGHAVIARLIAEALRHRVALPVVRR
jgi:lysophospholipase L1-like esterase